jgi:carboxylesterase
MIFPPDAGHDRVERSYSKREGFAMARLHRSLRTKASTRLVPEARPYRVDPQGATEAVLLLHGFTGIPRELSTLGDALAGKGYACFAPRYPGHGTDRADFYATGAEDWLRRAIDSYLELRSEYETVHVLGHSMGGLIATIVAATFNVPRLVLLAPAFMLTGQVGVSLSPLISVFTPIIRRKRENVETDPVRKELFAEYWKDDLVAEAAQLRRLQKAARRDILRVHSKILLLMGGKDDVVSASVAPYLEKRAIGAASFESKMIAEGGHIFPFDTGSGEAARIVVEWMRR